jgi:hypothetical protein
VLLIHGAMGAPSNRGRSVVGALVATAAICFGACDLNPQPLPPGHNGEGTGGEDAGALVGIPVGGGSSGGGSSSGGVLSTSDGGSEPAVPGADSSTADAATGSPLDASLPPDGGDAEADAADAQSGAVDAEGDSTADAALDSPGE